MPISGYQIEVEHPPFDSTALIGLKMSFCKFTFKLFLPELQKSLCFMPQSTLKEQCHRSVYA